MAITHYLAVLHHRAGCPAVPGPLVRHGRRLAARHLLLHLLDVLGRAPHQDLVGVFALQRLDDGGEVLVEGPLVLL